MWQGRQWKNECSSCKVMFGSLEKPFSLDINLEHLTYFDYVNRGSLMLPSKFIFNIILCGYCIFNVCISKQLESSFPALKYQKHTFIHTMEHFIVNNDKYNGLLLSCDVCETKIIIITNIIYTTYSEHIICSSLLQTTLHLLDIIQLALHPL